MLIGCRCYNKLQYLQYDEYLHYKDWKRVSLLKKIFVVRLPRELYPIFIHFNTCGSQLFVSTTLIHNPSLQSTPDYPNVVGYLIFEAVLGQVDSTALCMKKNITKISVISVQQHFYLHKLFTECMSNQYLHFYVNKHVRCISNYAMPFDLIVVFANFHT